VPLNPGRGSGGGRGKRRGPGRRACAAAGPGRTWPA